MPGCPLRLALKIDGSLYPENPTSAYHRYAAYAFLRLVSPLSKQPTQAPTLGAKDKQGSIELGDEFNSYVRLEHGMHELVF